MFCENCGKQIADGSRFCEHCGAPVQAVPPSQKLPGNQGFPDDNRDLNPKTGYREGSGTQSRRQDRQRYPDRRERSGSSYGDPRGAAPQGGGSKTWLIVLIVVIAAAAAAVAIFFGLRAMGYFTLKPNPETPAQQATIEEVPTEAGQAAVPGETPPDALVPALPTETGADTAAEPVLSLSELAADIARLNEGSVSSQSIDVFARNYTPAEKNFSLAWDNTLFYTLEDTEPGVYTDGQINSYMITHKSLTNAATGNTMDYEIYTRPGTDIINKIVSIEYMEDHLEIIDYYYTDDGRVNFIFVRDDQNYVPSYAETTKDGQRFYFNSDVLVKWRVVTNGEVINYVIGPQSAEQNTEGTEVEYGALEEQSRGDYNEAEIRMLNAAYNTLHIVRDSVDLCRISGIVWGINDTPRPGTVVWLRSGDEYLFRCEPDEAGQYTIAVPTEERTYMLEIRSPGCETVFVYDILIRIDILLQYIDTVYMVDASQTPYVQILNVLDALNYAEDGVNMMPVGQATVRVRRGVNARITDVISEGITDDSGRCTLSLLPGMYTAEVIKEGYDVIYMTFAVLIDNAVTQIHFSPALPEGEMRIVLSWDAEPEDLDSHLFTPYDSNYGSSGYHIFYGERTDAAGDNLDVDDTDGYGPETITIPVVSEGLYKYYVVDFTHCNGDDPTSYGMSRSNAVVNVYSSSGLVATFHVPANRPGVIWEVFEIRNGQIVPSQRYYDYIDGTWWHR